MFGGSHSLLAQSEELSDVALGWLGLDIRARLIVTDALKVRWANRRALECLGAQPMVHLRAGELVCQTAAMHRALADFVTALGDRVQTLAIEDDAEDDVLLLRGWGIIHRGDRYGCIELALDRDDFRPDYRDLQTVFGLTRAEQRVVDELLAGRTVTTTAVELNLSPGTVRTHVKHIYSKIGVASREELLRRLAPYRLV